MPKEKKARGKFRAYGATPEGELDPVIQSISSLRSQIVQLMERVEYLEKEKEAGEALDKVNQRSVGSAKPRS